MTCRPPGSRIARLAAVLLGTACAVAAQPPYEVRAAAERPVSADVVERVERLVAGGLSHLARHFPGTPARRFAVVVHRDSGSLPAALRWRLDEGTAGFALLGRDEIHLLLDEARSRPPHDLRTVVEHELVHVLIDQFAGDAGPHVPRWLHEGLAQELSEALYVGAKEEDIVFAAHTSSLIPFHRLSDVFPKGSPYSLRIAYAQSFSFVSYLRFAVGLQTLLAAMRRCAAERPFDRTFHEVSGRRLIELESEWVDYVKSGSGAGPRMLLRHCFSLLLVVALPLLAAAGIRRWRREHSRRLALEAEDAALDAEEAAARRARAERDEVDP